jgi:hypothetical protein
MSHPNDINLNTLEKMTSMKNMFGNSIIEILKPNIKSHQNESVIKMLEIAKDKPDTYMELLSVAIFHRNFEIIKYMVEKFNITESDSPFMSALSFYNSILPDNSEFKLNDARENYNMIQCPFVIMSGIGGDVEIFKYLSKKNLISNKDETGIIGLSKKLKNSFYSNIIGACCYYGRIELLEYLLKNNKFDLNFVTSEKKSKAGRVGYSKEYLGLTPAMLAVVGNISDENTVKILKILNNYNCKFTGFDHNKDNILHLATKNKKIETAKYLVDELNLKELMGNTNKDGNTPLSLAQKLNNEIFINYYSDKEKIDEKQIEENLKELINESNKIKDKYNKKKSKKNKNQDEPSLLNSTEYEETLKEIKPSKNKNKKKNYSTHNDVEEEYEEPKYKKPKKTNDDEENYNASNNSEKLRALLENPKPKKKKEKKENKTEINNNINKEKNEIKVEEEKKVEIKEEKKEKKEIKNNIMPEELEEGFIIGLGSKNKKNKKNKKNREEKEKERENELKKQEEEKLRLQQIEEEEKRKKEEEERIAREKEIEEQKRLEEIRKKEIEEEEREKERIRKLKEEEEREKERIRKLKEEELKEKERIKKLKEEELKLKQKQKEEEEKKQRELKELQERQAKEKEAEKKESSEEKEESEEDDDYSSEKNFLSEHEETKEKEKEQKYVSKEEYDNLSKKYIELDRRLTSLEKEKEEMSTLLRTLFLQNKTNKQIPSSANKEENINDLMTLANKELEMKNNIIHNLEGKVSKLDLRNVKEFSNQQLKEYKDFYTKQLKVINDALKQY